MHVSWRSKPPAPSPAQRPKRTRHRSLHAAASKAARTTLPDPAGPRSEAAHRAAVSWCLVFALLLTRSSAHRVHEEGLPKLPTPSTLRIGRIARSAGRLPQPLFLSVTLSCWHYPFSTPPPPSDPVEIAGADRWWRVGAGGAWSPILMEQRARISSNCHLPGAER